MRYAVYLRVSTDGQAEGGQGLEIQEAACRAWLRSGRHRLVEVCTDAGRSGAADVGHRPGLAHALALVDADLADGVLVYRLDRLARDMILQEQVLAELHRRGKELHSCSPAEDEHLVNAPDDPTRALVRQILGAVAGYERQVVRMRLMAGRERKRLSGGFAGGGVPYGWASERGELVPVPAEQEALRMMRSLHRAGRSYRAIAAALEARQITSRAPSGKWSPNTIWGIIKREDAKKRPAAIVSTGAREVAEVNA